MKRVGLLWAILSTTWAVVGPSTNHSAFALRHGPADVKRDTTFVGRVTNVVDGDTLILKSDTRSPVKIRVEGIDCPELGQPFSQAARNLTRQLTLDHIVSVRVLDVDRYGRLVARTTVEGKDLSVELVQAGLAWHFSEYSSDRVLEAAEREARDHRRGLWADPSPTPPWVQRRQPVRTAPDRRGGSVSGPFHANVRSGVYHANACKNARCQNCTRTFASNKEAKAAGFRPAGDCLKGQ